MAADSLTSRKSDALERLKEAVNDIWRPEFDSDAYLLRWLRARDFDVKKAEKMLRNHIVWRAQEEVDTILEKFHVPEVIQKYYPGSHCGQDREGRPLYVDPVGHCDVRGLMQSASRRDLIRSRVHLLETAHRVVLPQQSSKLNLSVEQIVVICDMDKFGLKHMWKPGLDLFAETTKVLEANYPETMAHYFIVNAPSLFPIVYNFVRPFLNPETQKKIHVLGSNFREELLQYFDPNHLPACYGGLMTDPDGNPMCRDRICWAGEVPPSYFLRCDRQELAEKLINRGGSLHLDYLCERGSRLQWEFETDSHDIKFGVFLKLDKKQQHKVAGGNLVPVLDLVRITCHLTREKGDLVCQEAGVYVIKFDNSYSWTRSKRIWYRVTIVGPEVEQSFLVADSEASGLCTITSSNDSDASGLCVDPLNDDFDAIGLRAVPSNDDSDASRLRAVPSNDDYDASGLPAVPSNDDYDASRLRADPSNDDSASIESFHSAKSDCTEQL